MRARELFGLVVLALTGGTAQAQTLEPATVLETTAAPAPVSDAAAPSPVISEGPAQPASVAQQGPLGPGDFEGLEVSDPFEGVNRGLYAVHNVIDGAVLEPLALGYRYVVPRPARTGVRNVLNNLNSPVVLVNDVLQGSPSKAGVTFARFGINTTLGVAGIFDVADRFGLRRRDEDFGQTLGVWGLGEGAYIFVPLLGPTNVRDSFGRVVDFAINPLTHLKYDGDNVVNYSRTALTALDTREQLIDPIRDMEASSADPYASTKRIYTKGRRDQIVDGDVDVDSLPDFEVGTGPS